MPIKWAIDHFLNKLSKFKQGTLFFLQFEQMSLVNVIYVYELID